MTMPLDRRALLLAGAAAVLAVPSAAALPAGLLGINTLWPPGDETSLVDRFTRARALGLDQVRLDWEWRLAEPRPGQYDWAATDRLMKAARRTGVSVLPIVHYAPDWALPDLRKGSGVSELGPASQAFAAFGRFLVACVQRYGPGGNAPFAFTPIADWQIWNEPNNKDFWGPEPEPKRFAALARTAAQALTPYRDRIRIIHAGLSKADVAFLEQLWTADPAYGETFDVMAVHPYIYDWWKGVRRPADIDADSGEDARKGFVGDRNKPNYLAKVFNIQLFMTRQGVSGRPIWITEMGFFVSHKWLGVSEEKQAALLAETMDFIVTRLTNQPFGTGKRALAADVQRVYWFALDDYTMPDDGGTFGLYRLDGSPRPSVSVLKGLLP